MDSGFRHRRSPSSDRFLGISSSAASIPFTGGGDELNEDDILWTNDLTEPSNNDHSFTTTATVIAAAAASINNNHNNRSPSYKHPHNSGILAALPERENRPVVYRKPSVSSSSASTSSKMIPSIPKPPLVERSQSMPQRKFQHSAPMNVPLLSIAMAKKRNSKFFELNEDDGDDEMLPPHEIVARGSGMSPKTTFSVLEGVGRTLKGRDLRQLGSYPKHVAASQSLQEHIRQTPLLARLYSTEASLQKEDSTTDLKDGKGFKGHDMLAPFTAGWQSNDLHPLVIEKSEGSYVYDSNGKKYLDSLAGLWCTALGGNEPRLVAAATAQLNTLPFYHSFWNRTTKPSLDLAKELLETFTASKMAKAFFTNSGSEANDTQVKLVWYYNNALGRPNKKKFIARNKSYHGSTLISASLSGLPALHQKFDLPAPFVLHTDCPHYWRYHLPGETEEEFSTRLANNLEELILKEGPETIAAFIAEPVMGAGGVIPPPATYFDKIQAIVKKYDILFIADEVICAFGRLGTMFGCDKYNIKPDLVSMAKALSSAYMPIGAVLVSPEVSDVIYSQSNKLGTFSHGFTYSGHPVSCAVAIEALKLYKERNFVEKVNKIAPRFQDGLKAFSDSPIIGEIRGTGLIHGTEFTDNKSPNDPFPSEWGVGAYFGAQCEKHGMLVRVAGDNIMMSPPFIITPEEVDELISIYGKALKATEERVKELKSQQKQ